MLYAFLLLVMNTPMDFIHLFSGHKDGIHEKHTGLEITTKHHHCSFLSLSVPPFSNNTQFPVVRFYVPEFLITHAALLVPYHQCTLFSYSLRGPPVA